MIGNAVLGVVQVEADGLDHQPFTALGILSEQLTEVKVADLLVMRPQGLPGRSCKAC